MDSNKVYVAVVFNDLRFAIAVYNFLVLDKSFNFS